MLWNSGIGIVAKYLLIKGILQFQVLKRYTRRSPRVMLGQKWTCPSLDTPLSSASRPPRGLTPQDRYQETSRRFRFTCCASTKHCTLQLINWSIGSGRVRQGRVASRAKERNKKEEKGETRKKKKGMNRGKFDRSILRILVRRIDRSSAGSSTSAPIVSDIPLRLASRLQDGTKRCSPSILI